MYCNCVSKDIMLFFSLRIFKLLVWYVPLKITTKLINEQIIVTDKEKNLEK